jgi:triosephosphate isomerase
MRIPFVAGNWKMNKDVKEARSLVAEMLPSLQAIGNVEKVICPPFTALMALSAMLAGSSIGLGAQDMYWEPQGAFTGEISTSMIKEFCEYVIIGHSERRTFFNETDETINRKLKAALKGELIAIVCIGETLAENEAGQTAEVIRRQLRLGLAGVEAGVAGKIVIAYEPVWAIGTGKAASGTEVNRTVAENIRPILAELFGSELAEGMRILYGGSVNPTNAIEFFSQSQIDGALVGGASLKPQDFVQITKAARK